MKFDLISFRESGLSFLPVKLDKRPLLSWDHLKNMLPTDNEINAWEDVPGIGIVCGKISGNLTCLDFDLKHDPKKSIAKEFGDLLKEWGREDLLGRFVIESTPSKGFHFLFRSPVNNPGEKLTRAVKGGEAIIETRGEGNYFVCAPTPGWVLLQGKITEIPTFTEEEAHTVFTACWALDRCELPPAEPVRIPRDVPEGKSTFDDYNDRATFEDIEETLLTTGWKRTRQRGDNVHYCRPGKNDSSTAATLHKTLRTFFVFSSSSEFPNGRATSPVGVYGILKHGGDFKAAAKDLAAQGYGDRKKRDEHRPQPKNASQVPAEVQEPVAIDLRSLKGFLLEEFDKPQDRGLETEWSGLEYRVADHQLTIVTGLPSHGKSTVMNSIAVHLAEKHGWRFIIHSAEDYPIKKLVDKLVRRHLRKSMYSTDHMTKMEYSAAFDWVADHFIPINANREDLILSDITAFAEAENSKKKIHGLIIDPWNEIDDHADNIKETDFIKKSLRDIRKMARRLQMHIWILAHPKGLQRNKDGKWPKPELSDINGSAHWRNKADNGIVIWQDMETRITSIQVHKIKFADYGKMGTEISLVFNEATQVFTPIGAIEKKVIEKHKEPEPEREVGW